MHSSDQVGILGSGDVGRELGHGFAERGWDVMIGSRSPESQKLGSWRSGEGARSTGTFAQTAQHGQTIVLATRGAATEDVLDMAGSESFIGKLVLDATNPLAFANGNPPGLLYGTTDSLGERVHRKLTDAKVVKCFNTVSPEQMVEPSFEEETPEMLICGDHEDAKKQVEGILIEFGWPGALDAGGIEAARWLEALVPLWARLGETLGTSKHAFTVVR